MPSRLWEGAGMTASYGQQTVNFQTACHPEDVKHYDTKTLRERFVMEKVMEADKINLTYSHYDRFIFGGAMPVNKTLKLENFPRSWDSTWTPASKRSTSSTTVRSVL